MLRHSTEEEESGSSFASIAENVTVTVLSHKQSESMIVITLSHWTLSLGGHAVVLGQLSRGPPADLPSATSLTAAA